MKKKRESGTMKKLIKKIAIAILTGTIAFSVVPATVQAAGWKQNKNGYWWQENDYSYPRNQWKTIYGKQYHFNSGGYMDTGWTKVDGRWYYLDPATGEMLTEWQLIPDLGYVYLNPYAPQPTWTYDEELKTWVYMEGAGRPYGSLYMAEWTPDGYYVNADGVWEPAR